MSKNDLPNTFLMGVQKAGSTLLFDLLKNHPSVYLPPNKEPHYFSSNDYFAKGIEYYRQFYREVEDHKIIGDFTPDYLFWPWAIERMIPFISQETKFIVSLRQPVRRAYSQYNMMVSRGFYMNGFVNDINTEDVNLTEPGQKNLLRPAHMIARGLYSVQLKRLFQIVPKDQIKVIIFEEWTKDQHETLLDIENFLGIPHHELGVDSDQVSNQTLIYPSNPIIDRLKKLNHHIHETTLGKNKFFIKIKERIKIILGKKPDSLDDRIVKELTSRFFIEDIRKCEEILGRDLSIWY